MSDRIMDAAGVMDDRQRAIYGGDHLGQAAGFKQRRHQNKIRGSVCQMCEIFIEIADGDPVVKLWCNQYP